MFEGKARAYLSGANAALMCLLTHKHLGLELIWPICKLQRKKFYNIDPQIEECGFSCPTVKKN